MGHARVTTLVLASMVAVSLLALKGSSVSADAGYEQLVVNRLGAAENDGSITFLSKRISGRYALLTYALDNGDRGAVLFSGPTIVSGGGGAMTSLDLASLNVPPQNAYDLIKGTPQQALLNQSESPGAQCITDTATAHSPATIVLKIGGPARQIDRPLMAQYWTSFYDGSAGDSWNAVMSTAYYAAGYYSHQGKQNGICYYATN